MGTNSNIEWTDHTWNPIKGCRKVSDGCKFCYFYRDANRYGFDPKDIVATSSQILDRPIKEWKDPARIFLCSWSDFFIDAPAAHETRPKVWEIIKKTPHHQYQILTKRTMNIAPNLPLDWGDGYDNVLLGASVENNNSVERIAHLVKVPAKRRFLSIEPLLEDVDLMLGFQEDDGSKWADKIHWIIVGGESGNETGAYRYRPCELNWIRNVVKQAQAYNIPVFVKQTGTWLSKKLSFKDRHGKDISEFPADLQIREFYK